jgi:hypothetical protein
VVHRDTPPRGGEFNPADLSGLRGAQGTEADPRPRPTLSPPAAAENVAVLSTPDPSPIVDGGSASFSQTVEHILQPLPCNPPGPPSAIPPGAEAHLSRPSTS